MELTTTGSGENQSIYHHHHHSSSFQTNYSDALSIRDVHDEDLELKWAAIEKLPTFTRLKTSLFDVDLDNGDETKSQGKRLIDVTKIGDLERHLFIEKLINHIENDNLRFLQKLRERIDRVGVKLPTVEVRYKNLYVEAECEVVQGNTSPTLWNSISTLLFAIKKGILCKSRKAKISILKDVSGVIKPSRLTLLLGPPGSGKTTLLLALAGHANHFLKVAGEVTYNGYRLDEFVPQKTSAYISQHDLHIPEMTVKETIDFSARCQGVGSREEIMKEVSKREKEAGIVPDTEIDTFMKATAVKGKKSTLQTDYILKVLGLDMCANIMIGDAMRRGISGGQKKRLTTGEMIVGPTKALFMDEISTGLDTSTTFQIISYIQQLVNTTDATALVALLQPAPETFELFDDIILMAEGRIVYHGPRSNALQYFENIGCKCPERKGVADFLQEVISKNDQEQYWCRNDLTYSYISVDQFCEIYKASSLGKDLNEELSRPYDKSQSHKNALTFNKNSLSKWELFKACMSKEFLLMKRSSFVYIFKTTQLIIIAFITMTIFIRTRMTVDLQHSEYFMGVLFYTVIRLMTNGVAEVTFTCLRLPVFYKQRSIHLYPAWAYCIPASIIKIPFSLLESLLWTSITYYVIGYSPEVERFLRQFILLFALHLSSTSLCRFVASVFQTVVAANACGSVSLVTMLLFGGFLLPRQSLPAWLRWGFWTSLMSYAEIGITLNEFLAPRWQKVLIGNTTLGHRVLKSHGLNFAEYYYWISVGALIGLMILFDIGFIMALTHLKSPGMSKAVISKGKLSQLQGNEDSNSSAPNFYTKSNTEKQKVGKFWAGTTFETILRLTLLLGPPGSGKTTLLLALAGYANHFLKVAGEVTYNGYKLDEFVAQKTSAYISQHDLHIPEMTVKETIDFSARCQGVGSREEIMKEVCKREKDAGIVPDTEIDIFMKATAVKGQRSTLQTDYILKVLGLDMCANIKVGDTMQRGISGGQKKRLTTGEMIVGPTKALFMDEISTGLDTSTTFQIISYIQQLLQTTDATALVALLQPAPETFELFDDIIIMAEGRIVYHGPRSNALEYFEIIGFKCPERKGVADFLQEVISEKDQEQYWSKNDITYSYISADQFCEIFKASIIGKDLNDELSRPYDKTQSHKDALSFNKNSLRKRQIFKACMSKEFLLMKRNSFVYIFKTLQLIITAFITMTIFIRTRMKVDLPHSEYFMGVLFYTIIRLLTNGVAEVTFTCLRLPVFYKQRSIHLYPAWAYCIPASIIKIPLSFIESLLWTSITYYVIGYTPEMERFFRQFILLFALHLSSISLCRFIASVFQNVVVASTCGSLSLVTMFLFGGFLLPRESLPACLRWGFWTSLMSYAEIGISVNEFLAPRWQKVLIGNTTLGHSVLKSHGLNFAEHYYWISVGALIGFTILFDIGFILALTFLKSAGMSKAIISKEKLSQRRGYEDSKHSSPNFHTKRNTEIKIGNVVLPFQPITMTFMDVQYFVEIPPEMREQGSDQNKLQLLQDMTGVFRPGKLTALMGISGAGKTTLIDVLSGRKNGGIIEGEINIGGYPKVQETFARISGYCEQNDIHSPYITVEESMTFSAWLRLPSQIDPEIKARFVQGVIEIIELDDIRDSIVGIPGQSGLSTEQRKRLTIAVEVVSNPAIMFMDEPTSGLDARSAAIVMRTVKNIAATGRTIICTIHQPSIDIFEAFDELILMKRGGQIIYSGMLGYHSSKLLEYFEGIPDLPKIKDNYNPATWMLEVTSESVEAELGLDFADIYKKSTLYQDTIKLVRELREPIPTSQDLELSSKFARNSWEQYVACLWKQHLSYCRNPRYNSTRFTFMIVVSVLIGAVFWQKGQIINNEQDLFNMLGLMFASVMFLGINNCNSIIPCVALERNVLYREKFAAMYSSCAYSLAQVTIEIPYMLLQAILFVAITYPSIGYHWSAYKFFWYMYATFCTFLYSVYLGMLLVSVSPNMLVATVSSGAVTTIMSIFSGFIMPGPKIPGWWIWLYRICPTSWSLYGLLSSQYGDLGKKIEIFGELKSVSSFLEDFFGFRHGYLGLVAFILIAFPIFFALLFAYCITRLNFQRR